MRSRAEQRSELKVVIFRGPSWIEEDMSVDG